MMYHSCLAVFTGISKNTVKVVSSKGSILYLISVSPCRPRNAKPTISAIVTNTQSLESVWNVQLHLTRFQALASAVSVVTWCSYVRLVGRHCENITADGIKGGKIATLLSWKCLMKVS